jgi:hypothetical protein
MAKTAFNKYKDLFTRSLDFNLRNKVVKYYIWNTALHSAETWTFRPVGQEYLESFEMWCWRRMENIIWTDPIRDEKVLHRFKEERNILHTLRIRKVNWIGHIWHKNCLLKHVTKGKTKGRRMGRRGKKYVISCQISLRKRADIAT